ncbi:MAG TPA: ParB N-terminal domain-containing protein [Acidobacteriota bacterium]|nr:ParB N-terminal domain-containing protein [Acidobacteriota bacterium]
MKKQIVIEMEWESIKIRDRSLALSQPWQADEDLLESVRRFGILVPLEVCRQPDGCCQVVHGFRRLEAARQAGLEKLPVRLLEGPEEDLFLAALEANRTGRSLTDLEAAAALGILRDRFGYEEKRLIEEVLPLLGRRADRRTLHLLLQVWRLDEELKKGIHQGLEAELAVRLAKRPSQLREWFLPRVERYRLGRNKQKEFFELLDDLWAASGQESLETFWEESGLASVEARGRTGPDRFAALLARLRRLRYPALHRHRSRFNDLRRRLQLPSAVTLREPPHFEGGSFQIFLTVSRPDELAHSAEALLRAARDPAFGEMCRLL